MLDITDYDRLMELMNEYKDMTAKIYVSLKGNTNYVSLMDMYKTCMRSNWKFADKHLDARQKMMQVILEEKVEVAPIDNFKNYGHETGLFQDVERVTKVLQKILEKKGR